MSGILTVARLELRMRLRTGRWRWLVIAWFLVLTAFMLLLRMAVSNATTLERTNSIGTVLYGGLQLFTLALALLVMPALTAQSVNGDRERGTLAVLQVTRLSAFQIAAGKLAAAWATAGLFVLTTAPLVVWSMAEGGVPLVRVVVVTLVVLLLLGVVCSIGLGMSAVLARSTTSSVLTYLAVFALTVGTLVVFGLGMAAATDAQNNTRPDRVWWLLAPNPFVVLADAAPVVTQHQPQECQTIVTPEGTRQTVCYRRSDTGLDPLGSIGRGVRSLRQPPGYEGPNSGGLVWPYGLGFDVALGAVMLWGTTRRLHTPRRVLPRGVRIA